MSTQAIVEHVDVVGDGGDRDGARRPRALRELGLQCAKEALDHGVVPAVAAPAAADDPFRPEQRSIVVARVLAPSIRMTPTICDPKSSIFVSLALVSLFLCLSADRVTPE
jgi:hypothetical protein